jgi:hypothetical protein
MRHEGITDKPVPPWQLPGAVRRDCEPHRVEFFQRLSLVTSLLAAAGALLVVPALLALGLAVAVWFMAGDDLALMRLGRMDPAGAADTSATQVDALAGALLPFFGWGLLALLAWLLGLIGACAGRAAP